MVQGVWISEIPQAHVDVVHDGDHEEITGLGQGLGPPSLTEATAKEIHCTLIDPNSNIIPST